jgi:hypothetical protein
MAKQVIEVGKSGADSRRVLEALTPPTGVVAPTINAEYIGQTYVDTVAKTVYISVAKGSASPADDWIAIAKAV